MISPVQLRSGLDRPWHWLQQHRHWWPGGVAFLAVVALAFRWGVQAGKHQEVLPLAGTEQASVQAVPVSVQPITLTTTPQWLDVTGTVQAQLEAAVAPKIIGRVQSVLVREGAAVHRGQTLVLLDARDLDATITQAKANLSAADVGTESARVTARMEASLSVARIAEAKAKVTQSEATLHAAAARLELVQAGLRPQEREQAGLAVTQAKSGLTLAENNLKRMSELYHEGAISAQQFDQYKNQYEVAKAQYETAQQSKSLAEEGSRAEEIRAAQEGVRQAQAGLEEAQAGVKQAQASALQADVRRQEIQGAQAQVGQSEAALQLARISRDDAALVAPFDGVVTKRLADPGTMASPGMPLLKIQGGDLRLEAVVPESVLNSVKLGAAVPVQFDALRNRSLTGHVAEIAPQGDPGSHTFLVKITLPSGSGASAGMFGRARFAIGTEQRMLLPIGAVSEREGLHYLYVVDESHVARLRMVTVGDPVGERLPILSGLNPGERVVVSGRERVTDGSPVTEETR